MDSIIRRRKITRVTITGAVVNMALIALKIFAGIAGRSAAIVADAVHSLSDFITDIIVICFVRVSSKPQDENHKYGHGKFETLATAIIGLVLVGVGANLLWNSGKTVYGVWFRGVELEQPGWIAFIAALVSIVAKEILYRYTAIEGRKLDSSSLIANAWHHRSDAYSSIGTMLGVGGAILLGQKWRVLDPLAALVVSILILKVAWDLIMPALHELLEKSLDEETEKEILDIITSVDGISYPHCLRTRRVGTSVVIDVHIRVDGTMSVDDAHDLTKVVERHLRDRFGKSTYIGLHVEPLKPTALCSVQRRKSSDEAE